MSEREHYQPGVPCWVDTAQPDPRAAIGFYGDLFGWDFTGPGRMPGEPPGSYFVARVRGRDVAGVSSQPSQGPPVPTTWNTYIAVRSADDTARQVRDAGGTVVVTPFDAPPAGRMAVLRDPVGALFCIWEANERQGAQLVNEPQAWAMSMLSTEDVVACAAFYHVVFGWETETFGSGAAAVTLWRLPGYMGGEPVQPVARDVVGAMAPIGDGGSAHGPSQWSVDFWVRDADAIAARAAELGGTVVIAPLDMPMFRRTVIADPQGAVFSVSTLVPPTS